MKLAALYYSILYFIWAAYNQSNHNLPATNRLSASKASVFSLQGATIAFSLE